MTILNNHFYSCIVEGSDWIEPGGLANNTIYQGGTIGSHATDFDNSGDFFVGGALFDTYSYTHPGGNAHFVYLGDSYALATGSPARNFGDANYAPSTDILGNARVGLPDAGCYEYVSSGPPAQQTYSLNVAAEHGTVTKSPNKASYNSGETVTLQAAPNTGYDFTSWSGDASGTNTSVTITMNSNKSVTANFAVHAPNTYTLSITATNGSVTKNPDQATYTSGTVVTLTATPATGYSFSGWGGNLSGSTNPQSITINANKTVTAAFTLIEYTLAVSTTGSGTVTKNPNQATYHYGDVVQLTANPATGYSFSGWGGNLSGSTNPQSITINANKTVTATLLLSNTLLPSIRQAAVRYSRFLTKQNPSPLGHSLHKLA